MVLAITYLGIKRGLKKVFDVRRDGSTLLDYDKPEPLGLSEERFSFYSGPYLLSGSRYLKKGLKGEPKGILVFFHGLGGGRSSYLHLISRFAEQGYLVYAFDATGSGQSEGPGIIGLGHYYQDMKAFFKFLDQDEKAKGMKRYAAGHSWGGYAAMLSLHSDFGIERAVSLSGFIDPLGIIAAMVKSKYLERVSFLTKHALKVREGKEANINGLEVALRSKKPLLYIQGMDDAIVPYSSSGALVEKAAKENPQIETYFIEKRRHSCYLTDQAEEAVEALWGVSHDIAKAGQIDTDLAKTGEEDPAVLKRMFDFLGG